MKTFGENIPVFRLRWDLPLEIGMVDRLRAPVTAKAFSQLQAQRSALAGLSVEAYNEQRRSYGRPALPPFFALFGAVAPKSHIQSRWIMDGPNCFRIGDGPDVGGQEALWNDVLFRLAAALNWPAESRPLIYPEVPSRERDRWTYPVENLVLSTGDGIAAVLPWNRGMEYLKFNQRERPA